MLREVQLSDAKEIAKIYNYYIYNTVITFEEQQVNEADIVERIRTVQQSGHFWFVAEMEGSVVGYAYSSLWRQRSAYRFSSEVTVYLAQEAQGKGLGTLLYQSLFERLKSNGIKCVIGGITLPNDASVALHEKLGMNKAAHFEKVGYKFEQWQDVGYWQLLLDK